MTSFEALSDRIAGLGIMLLIIFVISIPAIVFGWAFFIDLVRESMQKGREKRQAFRRFKELYEAEGGESNGAVQ